MVGVVNGVLGVLLGAEFLLSRIVGEDRTGIASFVGISRDGILFFEPRLRVRSECGILADFSRVALILLRSLSAILGFAVSVAASRDEDWFRATFVLFAEADAGLDEVVEEVALKVAATTEGVLDVEIGVAVEVTVVVVVVFWVPKSLRGS